MRGIAKIIFAAGSAYLWFALLAPAQVGHSELDSGNPVEREIRGDETHQYAIPAAKGQFIHVIADQKGVDLELVLRAPDGHELFRSDLPNGSYGPESVLTIAEEDGRYTVEAAVRNTKAPAGRYVIRLTALRPAEPTDRGRIAAELAAMEAARLRGERTESARRNAIAKLEFALSYFERSGDSYRQALTLRTIGLTHAELGDFRTALGYYNRALPLFRSVADSYGEATTVTNAGGVYDVLGDYPKALEYYDQALGLARRLGNGLGQAIALNNIGNLYLSMTDWQESISFFNRALPLFRELGDRQREAIALHNLGVSHNRLGEPEKALVYLDQCLPIRRAIRDGAGESASMMAIGIAHSSLGRSSEAVKDYEQAVALAQSAGDRRLQGQAVNQLGEAYASLGDPARALAQYQEALKLLQAAGDRRASAQAIGNIAQVYSSTGRRDEAREQFRRALEEFRAIGDRSSTAKMLYGMARVERDSGNLEEARRQMEAALAGFEEVRTLAGGGESRASYFALNQEAYHFYIDLLMRFDRLHPGQGYDTLALEASERARARSLLDMLAESRAGLREGADPELLVRERATQQLLSAKSERLMQVSGRSGGEAQAAALKDEIGRLETDYEEIEQSIRTKSPRYAALTQPRPATFAEIQRDVLDEGTLLLEYSLGEERSYLWAVDRTSNSAYELPGRASIEEAVRTVDNLVTARGMSPRGELPKDRIARIARADAELSGALARLSALALGPAASRLRDRRLAIVADGALQGLPFAMLPEPGSQGRTDDRLSSSVKPAGEPLVAGHEIVQLPSASVAAQLRRESAGRPPAPNLVAVFADPVFDAADPRMRGAGPPPVAPPVSKKEDETRILEHLADASPASGNERRITVARLPYTRQEADAILKVAGSGRNLEALDFRASRAMALSPDLSRYRYVHFATHGYLDTERPGLSALVLSMVDERSQSEDGFLRVNDIYNLRLQADLVVLSACQTGLGKEVKGEGLMGLTRAFLYAGAPRVVVSLWNVNDRATADLMAAFYRAMLRGGKTPSAALREAQLAIRKQKRWESPYYWAAFVQHGEWK